MKNPLRKRLLRELRQERGKYLVVFILMVATDWVCFRLFSSRWKYADCL